MSFITQEECEKALHEPLALVDGFRMLQLGFLNICNMGILSKTDHQRFTALIDRTESKIEKQLRKDRKNTIHGN